MNITRSKEFWPISDHETTELAVFLGPGFVTHFETRYFNFNFALAYQTAYTTKFSRDPLEPPSALDRKTQN